MKKPKKRKLRVKDRLKAAATEVASFVQGAAEAMGLKKPKAKPTAKAKKKTTAKSVKSTAKAKAKRTTK